MSQTNEEASTIPQMAGGIRGTEPPTSGNLVRPEEGPWEVARPPTTPRSAVDHQMPAEPHPQASVPPRAPVFTTAVEVDASTVDLIIKQHALALLRTEGYVASDGDFFARAEVLRVESGGVVVKVRR